MDEKKAIPFPVISLTKDEYARVELVAARKGITVEEAASLLVSGAMAKRIRRNTGKAPARVYAMKKKG